MREIKFRAWGSFGSDKELKMVYDWQDSEYIEYVGFDGDRYFDIMQYTGLKDRYGVPIYESDFVCYKDKFGNCNFEIGQVFFKDGAFWVKQIKPKVPIERSDLWSINIPDYEIIGNIHENLELLKK